MLNGMHTELTRLFDLTVPVVAAPMAGVADAGLAVAVSRAGALGCIGVGSTRPASWVAEQLTTAGAAGVPFGVGFMAWSLPDDPAGFELALAARPALVSIAFGDVAPWVQRARSAGIAVAVQVGTVDEAVAAERADASIVVARGGEAGGHGANEVATLPLLQQVLDAVSVPVLAAGGIATARGLAAVLAAGAAGAWVGTAFAGCRESTSAPAARTAMARADATGTIYGRSFDIAQRLAWPPRFGGRALANEFTHTWAGRDDELLALAGAPGGGPAEAGSVTAQLVDARARGDVSMAPVYCGQGVGQIRVDVPAADVVAEFARAEDLLRAAADRVSPPSGPGS
jgi:nitronate monooxygenase